MTIHELLGLKRPLVLFDLETTGKDPKEDRIVEIGLIQFRPDGTLKKWRTVVNPGRPIPPAATEKHGIDDARLLLCNLCAFPASEHPLGTEGCQEFKPVPTFKDLAANLLVGFTNADFAGFNVKTYDLPLLAEEFKREGIEWAVGEAKILDGYRLWQLVSPRTLTDFVECFTGTKLVDAHQALADVEGTYEGLMGLFRKHPELSRDLATLHDLQWPKPVRQPDWIDDAGKFAWRDKVAFCTFGKKWKNKPMTSIDRGFFTWMIGEDFTDDTKRVCRDALAGKYPKWEDVPLPMEPAE